MERLAAILISAHIIGDFLLQPDELVKRKTGIKYLVLHATIHAAIAYAALQAWNCWQAPLLVLIIHIVIDRIKQGREDTAAALVYDQLAHVLGLVGIAWLLLRWSAFSGFDGAGYEFIVLLAGFTATVRGAGFLVGKFARRLMEENRLELDGLLGGGKMIGQLERALIFLFIFTGQPAGIGFLVAAKSILRFEEAKKQKLAEYVLIGTLLSFSLAIALATATRWAMGL